MTLRPALLVTVAAAALGCVAAVGTPASATTSAHTYRNCTDLHRVYKHGVGKVGARDHVTSGSPVSTFTRNNAVYAANTKSDRDHDGIACEQH